MESWRLSEENFAEQKEGPQFNDPDQSSEIRTERWSLKVTTGRSLAAVLGNGRGKCHLGVCFRDNGRA